MPPKKRAALQTVPSLPPAVKAAESRRRSQLIEDEAECGDDVGKDENEEEPNEYDKNDSFINDEDEEDTDVEQNEENLDSPPLFDFNPRPVKVQRKLEKKKMVAARKPPSSGARKRIFPQELMDDNDDVPAKKKKKSLKEANRETVNWKLHLQRRKRNYQVRLRKEMAKKKKRGWRLPRNSRSSRIKRPRKWPRRKRR